MAITRRKILFSSIAASIGGLLGGRRAEGQQHAHPETSRTALAAARRTNGRTPVITPNGTTLPYRMAGGVKEFHLVAEPVKREFVDGFTVNCWGYNGMSPG